MGTVPPTFWARLRDVIPVVFLSAAFGVGAFASTTKYRTEQLENKIDVVGSTARAELRASVELLNVQMADKERRIQLLEQIAKATTDSLRELEKGQAVIAANTKNQKDALDRVEKKLDNLMERPPRP